MTEYKNSFQSFESAQIFISKNGEILVNKGFGTHTYENKSPPIKKGEVKTSPFLALKFLDA